VLLLLACSGEPETVETIEVPPVHSKAPHGPPKGHKGPPPGGPGPGAGGGEPFHATPTFELGESGGEQRNILVVSLDTVRADRLSVYGGRAETPALEALGGTRYTQAMTHWPETCLSHWAMLSGVAPELHGNTPGNRGSIYTGPTVAEIAQRQGYDTAAIIGGVTLTDESCGFSRGFEVFDDDFELDRSDMRRPGKEVTDAALYWLGERPDDTSWMLFVHYFDAHFPYTPPSPWDDKYDPDYAGTLSGTDADLDVYRNGERDPAPRDLEHILALYDGELSELDAIVAPLLSAVPEDTVVVVTSDHGESFGHGYWFNHRDGMWDSVLHVPLIIRAPDLPPGEVGEQVGLVDVAPTVLSLAGLPLDERMQGADLSAGSSRPCHYARTDPWRPDQAPKQFAWRTAEWKVITGGPDTLAYDLVGDPEEGTSVTAPGGPCAQADYEAWLEPLAEHQTSAPGAPEMTPEECRRLQKLGYLDPGACDKSQ